MVLIDKAALLNKIAKEVHYDSEHSLEIYAKMLSLINDAPDGVVQCKDCKYYNEHPSGFGCCEIHKGSIAIQTPFTYCAWGERREDETN